MSSLSRASTKRIRLGPLPPSDLPLGEAFLLLKDMSGLSYRELQDYARSTFPERDGTSHGWFSAVANDRADFAKPNSVVEFCELAAEMFGLDPEYFREYREALVAKRAADLTRRVGLDKVMEALDALNDTTG